MKRSAVALALVVVLALNAAAGQQSGIDENFYELQESSAPGTPGANGLRIYARDKNGVSELFYKNDAGQERDLSAQAGDGGIPAGVIVLSLTTCPSGFAEETTLSGKFVLGTVAANGNVGTTGGSDTVTPTFSGTPSSVVVNHTHGVTVTDPGHTHVVTSQTATTGAATSYEHGALDTSSAENEATETTASGTTGISATTANPAGGAASYTPAGTVSQIDNRPAFARVIFCVKS